MDYVSALVVTRSRLAASIARLTEQGIDTRDLKQVAADYARQVRDLRAAVLQVRMVPVTDVLDRVPLIVRGLTRSSGKEVDLEVDAGAAELDKAVAERVFPAIVHLVRNAVDHGIEEPEARVRAGKPAKGRLRITCSASASRRLEIVVEDDGAGIDRVAVAARAGAPVPETDAALLELLSRPGLSTARAVTTTSGRGMGMDIVERVVVHQLGGELDLETTPGKGTRFRLQIPLTVAIVDVFVIECAGRRYVTPVMAVEEILEIDPDVAARAPGPAGRSMALVERRGETMPLADLAASLGATREGPPARRAVVVRRANEPVAFLVDRVVGQQEAVVRPLVDPLVRVRGVPGATDLGDGRPTLLLDLPTLVRPTGPRGLPGRPPTPLLTAGARGAA
jgi:two-component system chemotaxis sensor kinase CheA